MNLLYNLSLYVKSFLGLVINNNTTTRKNLLHLVGFWQITFEQEWTNSLLQPFINSLIYLEVMCV